MHRRSLNCKITIRRSKAERFPRIGFYGSSDCAPSPAQPLSLGSGSIAAWIRQPSLSHRSAARRTAVLCCAAATRAPWFAHRNTPPQCSLFNDGTRARCNCMQTSPAAELGNRSAPLSRWESPADSQQYGVASPCASGPRQPRLNSTESDRVLEFCTEDSCLMRPQRPRRQHLCQTAHPWQW